MESSKCTRMPSLITPSGPKPQPRRRERRRAHSRNRSNNSSQLLKCRPQFSNSQRSMLVKSCQTLFPYWQMQLSLELFIQDSASSSMEQLSSTPIPLISCTKATRSLSVMAIKRTTSGVSPRSNSLRLSLDLLSGLRPRLVSTPPSLTQTSTPSSRT